MGMKAIVTGHSRGLGAAIAAELLAHGIAVLGVARGGNATLAAAYPQLLVEQALDLADGVAVAAWLDGGLGNSLWRDFAATADTLLLVNNAGMLQPVGPLAAQAPGEVLRAVSLNVGLPLALSSAAAAVRATRPLRVLHVSSGAARSAYAGWGVYGATKAALDQHARAVALDGSPGVKICSLAPGVIDTDMQAEIRAGSAALFPATERFKDLKTDGNLSTPAATAAKMVNYLLADGFGEEPVADLRDLG